MRWLLANLLRTDADRHREILADSELVVAVSVLARAQHDAARERRRQTARLRSALREFYPAALRAFPDLTTKTALTVLSGSDAGPGAGPHFTATFMRWPAAADDGASPWVR